MTEDRNLQAFYDRIAANVREVRDRIVAATQKSGRNGKEVNLVAVSKYATVDDGMIEAFLTVGCLDLGESRPQSLVEKAEHFVTQPVRWHMIGSLQRNKVRKILPIVSLIHSLDSLVLAEAIERIAEEESLPPVSVLVETAISGDATKHGFGPEEIPAALDKLAQLKSIAVKGLMCMSGLESDENRTRREFEAVRKLAESLRQNGLPPNISMDELSMGMSDDFEIAIEEGATIVRVGSLLYR